MARLSALFANLFGRVQWTPPGWLTRLGGRRITLGLLTLAALVLVAVGVKWYLDAQPQPPQVVAHVVPLRLSDIVENQVQPQPLLLNFSVVDEPTVTEVTGARVEQPAVDSVAALDQVGEIVSQGVSLVPALPGEWRWVTENQLQFSPAADWPADQDYTVTLNPRVFAPNLALERDEIEFTTPEFIATVDDIEFYQDPVRAGERSVVATLSFSHPVALDELRNRLTLNLRQSGSTVKDQGNAAQQTLRVEVTLEPHGRTAYVHSQLIDLPAEPSYARLEIASGLEPSLGRTPLAEPLSAQVLVPDASSYFQVSQVQSLIVRNADDDPVQTLMLSFSDQVSVDALQAKLKLFLLPMSVRNEQGRMQRKYWRSPREVTPAVLAQAKEIAVTLNPTEHAGSMLHSSSLDLPQGRSVYVQVEQGLGSVGQYQLSQDFDQVIELPRYPVEVKIAQAGAVLPLTSNRRLGFVARGLPGLRVELARLNDADVNHLASQTGGDLESPYFSGYQFDQDNITTREVEVLKLNSQHPAKATFASLDISDKVSGGGYYFVTVQGWDEARNRAIGPQDKRFVLVTDIGLLVKTNADNSHDVFVHSIASGKPLAGANIELLGKNGVAIATQRTSATGHAKLPVSNGFTREKAPTVFVVRHNRTSERVSDSVFLPYARQSRALQYSRFDVGGEYAQQRAADAKLRAQLFTDRGIYRPGDTVNIAAVVKRDDWGDLPEVPLNLTVSDARGQSLLNKNIRLPKSGLFDQQLPTTLVSSTGSYQVTLFLVDEKKRQRVIGSAAFQVEEFQPDRLRIRAEIAGQNPSGWVQPAELFAQVSLHNLFGTPAQARQVTGSYRLIPAVMQFSQYPDYRFDDPQRDPDALRGEVNQTLTESVTDEQGQARLAVDLSAYNAGIYRLQVTTQGYEAGGGRSVTAQASAMVSPMDYLVGYKTTSDLSFLTKDSEHKLHLLAVDSRANARALPELQLSLVEFRYVSTLVQQPNGTYAYQSVRKETAVSSTEFAIPEVGADFQLPTDKAGSYAVKVATSDGLVLSRVEFNVAGARNVAGNLEQDAELKLLVKGDSFAPGAEVEIEITAPYAGTGLITIERDSVYSHQWFQSVTNTSVQRVRIPPALEGNAYINVAFVRSIDSPEIFVSPLSYAVAPFSINRDARTVEIELKSPEQVLPGATLNVQYRTDKPSRMVLYAVDEGILQVAKYQMPNPLEFFLPKMALQVGTLQMADLILPEFATYRRLAAPGGGMAKMRAGANLNPFQRITKAPVAFWSGVLDAGPEFKTYAIPVPDSFNGTLRLMAVAVASNAVGRKQAQALVKGPFVITPSVVTAVAPGDEFDVNVGLANNREDAAAGDKIELTVTPSAQLELVGAATQTLEVAPGREGRSTFRVKVLDQLGAATLSFVASSTDKSARLQTSLSVRPATAYITTLQSGVSKQDPLDLAFDRLLYEPFAEQKVAASASPLIVADGLLSYLERFPHACAEQIVSKSFPQLGLLNTGDAQLDRSVVAEQFKQTVAKLRSRQMADGGFAFWESSAEAAEFPSVYILHFFTDAAALGLTVPKDMLSRGLKFLHQIAAAKSTGVSDARLRAYAIYVLTRNAVVTTNYLTDLHEHLEGDPSDAWSKDLTTTYMAASYHLLQQPDLAKRLLANYAFAAQQPASSDFDTQLGRDAQYLYLLARHFPTVLGPKAADKARALIEEVMANRFNTLSSAYTVLALGEYSRAQAARAGTEVSISAEGKLVAPGARFARAGIDVAVRKISLAGSQGENIFYVLSQAGYDLTPPMTSVAEGIEVSRDFLDTQGEVVSSAAIGDELTVRLRVRSTGKTRTNVALVDLLPGGFEVLRESVRNAAGGWRADHTEVREDRVVVYGAFPSRLTEFSYRAKVTSAGEFAVPSLVAQSMYDRNLRARTEPGRFVVSAQ